MEAELIKQIASYALGPAGALVIALLWVRHMKLDMAERSRTFLQRIQELEKRNDELSDSLVEVVRSSSRERAESATNTMLTNESILRTTLASLESALTTRPRG